MKKLLLTLKETSKQVSSAAKNILTAGLFVSALIFAGGLFVWGGAGILGNFYVFERVGTELLECGIACVFSSTLCGLIAQAASNQV
jgi:hypothetical protein